MINKLFLEPAYVIEHVMPKSVLVIISATVSVFIATSLAANLEGISLYFVLIVLLAAPFLLYSIHLSEKYWIPIVISLLVFRDYSFGDLLGGGTLKIGDIFIFYVFCIWLFRNLFMDKSTKLVKSKLDSFILLFVFFYVISLFWAIDLDYGFVRVFKLIRNLCLFLIIRDLFITDFYGNYKRITISFIVTGILLIITHLSVLFLAGAFSDFLLLFHAERLSSVDMLGVRMRGTGGGFLISGSSEWLNTAGVLIFGSLMLYKSKTQKTIRIFLLILMFASSTVMTLSRTPLAVAIMIFVVLLIGSLKLRIKSNIATLVSILIIIAMIGIGTGIVGLYSKRFVNAFEDQSWVERTLLYRSAYNAFLDSPITGIGPGSNYYWQLNDPDIDFEPSRIVHSTYLTILSEVGIIGSLIFIVVLFYWLRYLWQSIYNRNAELYIRNISLVIFAFSIAYLISVIVEQEFESFAPWIMMGIVSAIKNVQTKNRGIVRDEIIL